jgi:hypothetical protein
MVSARESRLVGIRFDGRSGIPLMLPDQTFTKRAVYKFDPATKVWDM